MLALLLGKLLNLSGVGGGENHDNKDKRGIIAPALYTVD